VLYRGGRTEMEARSHALLIFSFIAWSGGRGCRRGGRAAAIAGVERWRRMRKARSSEREQTDQKAGLERSEGWWWWRGGGGGGGSGGTAA
jgi:hypothetical protein